MQYTRMYTHADGLSHFEDIEVRFTPESNALRSSPEPAGALIFGQFPADLFHDWHTAPAAQFAVFLSGEIEVEASGGELRRFGPGSILLSEDCTGRGHIVRGAGRSERRLLLLPIGSTRAQAVTGSHTRSAGAPLPVPAQTTFVRLCSGADGLAHFEDVVVPLHAGSGNAVLSEPWPVQRFHFGRGSAADRMGWHPAPRRQFVITLSGESEIEASDGEVRRFGPGSVLLPEDTTGKGHISRGAGSERLSITVPLVD